VTITFDDGYHNIYENAYPILEQLGLTAVLFIKTPAAARKAGERDYIIDSEGNKNYLMNVIELKNLLSNRWEMASHTVSHTRLSRLPPEQIKQELTESRDWIAKQGLGDPISFAYPHGDGWREKSIEELVGKYYYFGRTIEAGFNEISCERNVILRSIMVYGSSQDVDLFAAWKQMTVDAQEKDKWLIFVFHGVPSEENHPNLYNGQYWISAKALMDFLSFVKNTGVPVRTFSELISSRPPNLESDSI
jgi:peptidoglycan/xylan/chitin deacetylase (PgdA/CDA1 family)